MADDWESMIVWDRMEVDQEFAERVQHSRFSRQEWGMIMTAVEFRIVGEGRSAELVADTSKIEQILPELEHIKAQLPSGGAGRSGSRLVDSLRSLFGITGGGGVDQEELDEAVTLVEEYAVTLQAHLEDTGKWRDVRNAAN